MVNPRLIAFLTGWIVIIAGGTLFLPILPALYYDDEGMNLIFLRSGVIAVILGGLLIFLGFKARKQEARSRDSLAVVGVSWFLISLLGALPYYFSGLLDVWGALFESFSGFSSTGSTNVQDLEIFPEALLFWRSFTQYLGGMGIIVLMVAVLPFLGVGGQLMLKNELSGLSNDKLKPRVAQIAKILWMVYLGFTIVFFLLYLGGGAGVFNSLCLTFTTLSTGGFANFNNSLGHYQGFYFPVVSMVVMFLGSISFAMHYQLLTGHVRAFWRNPEILFFSIVIITATLLISASLIVSNVYQNPGEALFYSLFHAISILSTTGHALVDWGKWPSLAITTLFFLFFIGGCSGSTSGGLKCVRWIIMFKSIHRIFRRYIHPRGVFPIRLNGKPVPDNVLEGVWLFFILYIIILAFSTLILAGLGLDFLTSLSAAASALGNVGPGLGPLGPANTMAWVPGPAKGLLSLLMLLGRLEFYSFLVIFIPEFWSK
ncbi:MAG: TrkH family potassium uptake protein [Deltaproteobacteria bacterium]|jgi:trk system potassium uptake protein TrkH|nr:TrkH family potassium uptake protein [Deltaproteobacteria bacterium]